MTENHDTPPLTEDMVRKLLQMNPHLRGSGQTTKDVLQSVRARVSRGPAEAAPPSGTSSPKSAAPAPDLDGLLLALSRQRDAETIERKKEEELVATRLRQCDEEERRARAQALELLIDALLEQDPALVRPEHGSLLEGAKAFLARIEFTPDRFLAAKRKRGK